MIFFYCPDCKEELEAEDSIRGAKMKCPACFKEIEVPQVGVKVEKPAKAAGKWEKGREDREGAHEPPSSSGGLPEAKFLVTVLVIGLAGLLAICGVGYILHKRSIEQAERARPKCDLCAGKGAIPCTICAGAKKQSCKDCNGSGHRKNFRDQDEECYVCSGKGLLDCRTCGGRGEYGCKGCNGVGRLTPLEAPRK